MNTEKIDNEIVLQLENNGLKKGDREQRIKLLLTHAYMAVRMYWAMSPEDRFLATQYHKKFRRSFSFKNFLKERKRSTDKGKFPPHPRYKEIASKDKLQNISLSGARKKDVEGSENGILERATDV